MALYKLVDTASFYPEDLSVQVLDLASPSGELVKRAADESILAFVKDLQPRTDRIYLHINAMGAGECYGSNRNGDYFPEEVLKRDYKTFETSPAHVFRHHINKDPAKSIGKVIYAIYNDRMHRVELIAEVDRSLGKDVEERVAKGDFPATSMACKTPYDICSICGNKARTRDEYCEHIKKSLNKLLPDGRKVMALNVANLKFFDISIVIRPADITSSVLQKVASENGVGFENSSVVEGEIEGLSDSLCKSAAHQKLADLIKEIDGGTVVGTDHNLDHLMSKMKDPHIDTVEVLKHFAITDVLTTMAMLGMSPSLTYLGELIARKTLGNQTSGYGKLSYEALKLVKVAPEDIPDIFNAEGKVEPHVVKVLSPYMESSSFMVDEVEKRASLTSGYAFGGPHVDQRVMLRGDGYIDGREVPKSQDNKGLLKTLVGIALSAIAAKWYINSQIEKKLFESRIQSQLPNPGAKIVIIKQASVDDLEITAKLIKLATIHDLSQLNRDIHATGQKAVGTGMMNYIEDKLTTRAVNFALGRRASILYRNNVRFPMRLVNFIQDNKKNPRSK